MDADTHGLFAAVIQVLKGLETNRFTAMLIDALEKNHAGLADAGATAAAVTAPETPPEAPTPNPDEPPVTA